MENEINLRDVTLYSLAPAKKIRELTDRCREEVRRVKVANLEDVMKKISDTIEHCARYSTGESYYVSKNYLSSKILSTIPISEAREVIVKNLRDAGYEVIEGTNEEDGYNEDNYIVISW
jgi:hypothetical protein